MGFFEIAAQALELKAKAYRILDSYGETKELLDLIKIEAENDGLTISMAYRAKQNRTIEEARETRDQVASYLLSKGITTKTIG